MSFPKQLWHGRCLRDANSLMIIYAFSSQADHDARSHQVPVVLHENVTGVDVALKMTRRDKNAHWAWPGILKRSEVRCCLCLRPQSCRAAEAHLDVQSLAACSLESHEREKPLGKDFFSCLGLVHLNKLCVWLWVIMFATKDSLQGSAEHGLRSTWRPCNRHKSRPVNQICCCLLREHHQGSLSFLRV